MPHFYSLLYKYQYRFRLWIADKSVSFKKKLSPGKSLPFDRDNKSPKIVFVLTGLIGDSIMSIPVIIEAKQIWPNSRITVLGKRQNLELLEDCPFVDQFYETPVIPFSIKKKNKKKKLLKWLKQEKFDISVILLGDQFAKVLYDAGIPYRIGVKGQPLQSCLTHIYDIRSSVTWTFKERLNALRCLGYTISDSLPVLWTNSFATETASKKLIECGLKENSYIVLHPFGSSQRQWWDLNLIPATVQELHKRHSLQTILVGGKETVGIVPAEKNMIDTTGRLTLAELKAVITNAVLIITTDSGPFHIAGAFQKKTIGLFRARRPELAHIYPGVRIIFGKDQICQLKCKWDHCRSIKCIQLQNISSELVLTEVKNILEKQ